MALGWLWGKSEDLEGLQRVNKICVCLFSVCLFSDCSDVIDIILLPVAHTSHKSGRRVFIPSALQPALFRHVLSHKCIEGASMFLPESFPTSRMTFRLGTTRCL
jgi:hypothetical protein